MRSQQRAAQQATEEEAPEVAAPSVQEGHTDVDALLDEIDDVLEENAEAFVQGFVQKGGE